MVTYGDLTLGGEHTVWCTDDVLENRTPQTYIIVLTNVTLMHLIKIFKKSMRQKHKMRHLSFEMDGKS